MKLRLLKVFLLVVLLSSPTFSQKVPKWKFLAPLWVPVFYDLNHYMGLTSGGQNTVCIYNKMGDTIANCLALRTVVSTDSTYFSTRSFCYGDSLTIFVHVDSVKSLGLSGLNLIEKYLGLIFKTIDGGKTWKKIQLNPNFRSRKSVGLNMRDKMNGIVV
ncbi:hypothetical protein D9V87_10190, partial [Bacteroidetes/Chlorobi group bacterium MS-B_bin-24]